MSDFPEFNPTPEPEGEFTDAFSSMEDSLNAAPAGAWIQIRNGGNAPVYAPLYEGEESLSVAQAIARAGLFVGAVTFYVDNAPVPSTAVVPNHGVIEIVGAVKGGSK